MVASSTFSTPLSRMARKLEDLVDAFGEALYDLGADPYELTNRHNASTRPKAIATRLQALKTLERLIGWLPLGGQYAVTARRASV